jgi:hypothetical protein
MMYIKGDSKWCLCWGEVSFFIFLFFIPLQAKRVGEFIKNGHKKILPTRIGSGSGVTL